MRGVTYIMNLEKDLTEIKENLLVLRKNVSKCDKAISDIVHECETRKANAFEGWTIYKELSEVAQKRRAWKSQLHELEDAFNELGGEKKLKHLIAARKKKVEKYTKRNSWFDNFSPEAMAILNGGV